MSWWKIHSRRIFPGSRLVQQTLSQWLENSEGIYDLFETISQGRKQKEHIWKLHEWHRGRLEIENKNNAKTKTDSELRQTADMEGRYFEVFKILWDHNKWNRYR